MLHTILVFLGDHDACWNLLTCCKALHDLWKQTPAVLQRDISLSYHLPCNTGTLVPAGLEPYVSRIQFIANEDARPETGNWWDFRQDTHGARYRQHPGRLRLDHFEHLTILDLSRCYAHGAMQPGRDCALTLGTLKELILDDTCPWMVFCKQVDTVHLMGRWFPGLQWTGEDPRRVIVHDQSKGDGHFDFDTGARALLGISGTWKRPVELVIVSDDKHDPYHHVLGTKRKLYPIGIRTPENPLQYLDFLVVRQENRERFYALHNWLLRDPVRLAKISQAVEPVTFPVYLEFADEPVKADGSHRMRIY